MTEPESHQVHAKRPTAHVKPRAAQLPFPGSTPVFYVARAMHSYCHCACSKSEFARSKDLRDFDGRRRLACAAIAVDQSGSDMNSTLQLVRMGIITACIAANALKNGFAIAEQLSQSRGHDSYR